MCEELNKVVTEYLLSAKTDYAIMINGKWGCGKSYYIEQELNRVINQIVLPQDENDDFQESNKKVKKDSKKRTWLRFSDCPSTSMSTKQKTYKKAHISLYGITNVKEFHRQILYGLHPSLQNKWIGFLEYGIDKLSQGNGFGGVSLDSKLFETNLRDYVLVFDDLERLSPELSVIDVMGWINSYTENQHCKVVLVCNEDAVKEQAEIRGDNRYMEYLKYKEKTIRYTYVYESDVDKVYDALIVKKTAEEKTFYEKHKRLVLELFNQGGENNLRTLIFILDCLYRVCQSIIAQKVEEEIVEQLIITFVVYAMEHKRGATREQLNTIVKEELNWNNLGLELGQPGPEVMRNDGESAQEEPKVKPWKSSIESSYITQMYRMPELIDYIITGDLNQVELKKSIDRQVAEFKKQQETPQGKLLKELHDFVNISDDKFLDLIAQLKANVKGNLYNMYELLEIYIVLTKFHFFQIQGFRITMEWDQLFQRACDRAAETHIYDSRFELCVPMWDPSDKSEEGKRYNRVKAYAIQWNRRCEQEDGKEEAKKYIQTVKSNDINALCTYRQREDALSLVYNLDMKSLWKLIISPKTTNPVACATINNVEYWVVKYGSNPEIWKPLYDEVTAYLNKKRRKNPIRVMYLYTLQGSLKERIYGR